MDRETEEAGLIHEVEEALCGPIQLREFVTPRLRLLWPDKFEVEPFDIGRVISFAISDQQAEIRWNKRPNTLYRSWVKDLRRVMP